MNTKRADCLLYNIKKASEKTQLCEMFQISTFSGCKPGTLLAARDLCLKEEKASESMGAARC